MKLGISVIFTLVVLAQVLITSGVHSLYDGYAFAEVPEEFSPGRYTLVQYNRAMAVCAERSLEILILRTTRDKQSLINMMRMLNIFSNVLLAFRTYERRGVANCWTDSYTQCQEQLEDTSFLPPGTTDDTRDFVFFHSNGDWSYSQEWPDRTTYVACYNRTASTTAAPTPPPTQPPPPTSQPTEEPASTTTTTTTTTTEAPDLPIYTRPPTSSTTSTTTTTTTTTTTSTSDPRADGINNVEDSNTNSKSNTTVIVAVVVPIVVVVVAAVVAALIVFFCCCRKSSDESKKDESNMEYASGEEGNGAAEKGHGPPSASAVGPPKSTTPNVLTTPHQRMRSFALNEEEPSFIGDDGIIRPLQAHQSIMSHRSAGLSPNQSIRLHELRHRATSDVSFGRFIDDNDDDLFVDDHE